MILWQRTKSYYKEKFGLTQPALDVESLRTDRQVLFAFENVFVLGGKLLLANIFDISFK